MFSQSTALLQTLLTVRYRIRQCLVAFYSTTPEQDRNANERLELGAWDGTVVDIGKDKASS
jgi:hypothetical protein